MAKTKQRRGAKSRAIRAHLEKNPKASAAEVVTALKEQGITVTPAFVYNLRAASKRKSRKARRQRVAAANANGSNRTTSANGLTAEQLLATKKLADQLGGTQPLRRALEVLEKLS